MGKQKVTYSECVSVLLVIQHATRKRRITLAPVACPAHHISHILSQTACFGGGELLNIKRVLSFSIKLMSETFLILRRNERDIIINIHVSTRKAPVNLFRFQIDFRSFLGKPHFILSCCLYS